MRLSIIIACMVSFVVAEARSLPSIGTHEAASGARRRRASGARRRRRRTVSDSGCCSDLKILRAEVKALREGHASLMKKLQNLESKSPPFKLDDSTKTVTLEDWNFKVHTNSGGGHVGTGNMIVGNSHKYGKATNSFFSGYGHETPSDFNVEGAAFLGGATNTIRAEGAVVAGGTENIAMGQQSFIAGGMMNNVTGNMGAVVGGRRNAASYAWASVFGGDANVASANFATVAGGENNKASSTHSTVVGRA